DSVANIADRRHDNRHGDGDVHLGRPGHSRLYIRFAVRYFGRHVLVDRDRRSIAPSPQTTDECRPAERRSTGGAVAAGVGQTARYKARLFRVGAVGKDSTMRKDVKL